MNIYLHEEIKLNLDRNVIKHVKQFPHAGKFHVFGLYNQLHHLELNQHVAFVVL